MKNVMNSFLEIIPVLPSAEISRDIAWYQKQAGFETIFADKGYALLKRDGFNLHLQWHADTVDDPLLGGSVIRISVKDIYPVFEEFVERGTVKREKLRLNTAWRTHEFGFYDLNKNAIFIAQNV